MPVLVRYQHILVGNQNLTDMHGLHLTTAKLLQKLEILKINLLFEVNLPQVKLN